MAGRKKTIEPKKTSNTVARIVDSDSENEVFVSSPIAPAPAPAPTPTMEKNYTISKPSIYLSNGNLKASDSDRIHLAQAINNFTLKSEQLLQEMKNFETFKESIVKLDILIETKKQEYKEMNDTLEQTHKNQIKKLELDYVEMTKKLKSEYAELLKKK